MPQTTPRRVERELISVAIVAGDAGAQGRNAERLGIADAAMHERRLRRCDRRCRRRRRRLADLHVHDAGAFGLELRCRRHHVHHHERRHIAAFGRH